MSKRLFLKTADSVYSTDEIFFEIKSKNIILKGFLSVTTTISLMIWALSCLKRLRKAFIVVKAKNV